jgi:hypothetical protein
MLHSLDAERRERLQGMGDERAAEEAAVRALRRHADDGV